MRWDHVYFGRPCRLLNDSQICIFNGEKDNYLNLQGISIWCLPSDSLHTFMWYSKSVVRVVVRVIPLNSKIRTYLSFLSMIVLYHLRKSDG